MGDRNSVRQRDSGKGRKLLNVTLKKKGLFPASARSLIAKARLALSSEQLQLIAVTKVLFCPSLFKL